MPNTNTLSTWVYLGTNIQYNGDINQNILNIIECDPETKEIMQGSFYDSYNGCLIILEKVSMDTLNKRTLFYAKHVWIDVANVKLIEDDLVDLTKLINTKIVDGMITGGTILGVDGSSVELLLVSKGIYSRYIHNKDLYCVYECSHLLYSNKITGCKLTLYESTTDTLLKGALLLENEMIVNLDFITRAELARRKSEARQDRNKIWVEKGSFEVVNDSDIFITLSKVKTPKSIICNVLLKNGEIKTLERITRNAARKRKLQVTKIWIDESTGVPFDRNFDTSLLIYPSTNKTGSVTGGMLMLPDGQIKTLVLVSKNDLRSYKKIWIRTDNLKPFKYPENPQILSEVTINGSLKRTLLLADESTVTVEFISNMALRKRQTRANKTSAPNSVNQGIPESDDTALYETVLSSELPFTSVATTTTTSGSTYSNRLQEMPQLAEVGNLSPNLIPAETNGYINTQDYNNDINLYPSYPPLNFSEQQSYLPDLAQPTLGWDASPHSGSYGCVPEYQCFTQSNTTSADPYVPDYLNDFDLNIHSDLEPSYAPAHVQAHQQISVSPDVQFAQRQSMFAKSVVSSEIYSENDDSNIWYEEFRLA